MCLFLYFKWLTSWPKLIYWVIPLFFTHLKCHFYLKLFLYLVRAIFSLSILFQWSLHLFIFLWNSFNYWSYILCFNRQWLHSWRFHLFPLYSFSLSLLVETSHPIWFPWMPQGSHIFSLYIVIIVLGWTLGVNSNENLGGRREEWFLSKPQFFQANELEMLCCCYSGRDRYG